MNELKKYLKMWPTWWTLPLIVLVVYYMPEIIQFIDPTGSVVHPDFWQFVFMAAAIVILFNDVVFAAIYINHPYLWKWYQEKFEDSTDHSPWLLLCYYAVLMLCLVLTLMALV